MLGQYRTRFKNILRNTETVLIEGANIVSSNQRALVLEGLGIINNSPFDCPSKRLRGTIASLLHAESECSRIECRHIPAILEFIHAASLIVDDLQEGHLNRWGRPALWVRHGEPIAINTAFTMLAIAFKLNDFLGLHNNLSLPDTLNEMLDAQANDLLAQHLHQKKLAGYLKIASGKTGALFGLAIELGGHALDRGSKKSLTHWANCLGIAHQIQDDIDDLNVDKTNIILPNSNLYFFLSARSAHSSYEDAIGQAGRLAKKYVEKGQRELTQANISELLKDDLVFVLDTVGRRQEHKKGYLYHPSHC